MMKIKIALLPVAVLLAALLLASREARAIPTLQIYIEGSTYDSSTDTWAITTPGTFNLWVLGDVANYGTISEVKLSAAVMTSEVTTGLITLASTTATGITDPSAPQTPVSHGLSGDGAIPVKGDGKKISAHGIYGPGTSFYEWELGDLNGTDSPLGDYSSSTPTAWPSWGQINAYTVTVTGFTWVHFDAYDHIEAGQHTKYVFAPYSHDGESTTTQVPEPATLILLGSGLALLGWRSRKK